MEVGVLFSLLESGGSCMSKTNLKSLNSKKRFSTILADPPWRFTNRTGKWLLNTSASSGTRR